MKKNLLLVLMCMFAVSIYAKKETTTVTFNVPLDCENCVKTVEGNIAFEKGVKALDCNLAEKTVTVTYFNEKTNVENLKKGFEKIGYKDITEKKACCSTAKTESCCSKDTETKKCDKSCSEDKCCSKDDKKEACSKDSDATPCCEGATHSEEETHDH